MKHLLSCTLLFALALFSCKTTKEAVIEESEPQYETGFTFNFVKSSSLYDVVDLAEKENKLVFLDIYTDWCLPCKVMEEEVFTDESLGDFFNQNFISFKINAETSHGSDLQQLYKAEGYPTLLFLDHKGRVLERKKGLTYSRELRDLALSSIDLDQANSATD